MIYFKSTYNGLRNLIGSTENSFEEISLRALDYHASIGYFTIQ